MYCFVLEYFHPHLGGVETLFSGIVEGLYREYGKRSIVLCSLHDETLPQREEYERGSVIRVLGGRKIFALTAVRYVLTHRRFFADVSCVYTSTFVAGFAGRGIARFLSVPCILTVHEVFGGLWNTIVPGMRGSVYHWVEKALFALPFAGYHAVSQSTRALVCQYYPSVSDNILFIPNAIDYSARNRELIDPSTIEQLKNMYGLSGKRVYMYAGHCGGSKGVDILLDAWEQRAAAHPDCLLIVNFLPSHNRDAMLRRVYASPIRDQYLVFLGMTKRELLAKVLMADVVVIPSRSEGFGIFAAEVSSIEIPMIVSRSTSLPEVVSGSVWRFDTTVQGLYDAFSASLSGGSASIIFKKTFERKTTIDGVAGLIEKVEKK